ncbi:hypothetical protein FRX31_032075 [Thalictrum thalictroides]|uniref:U-box domain-containing protein n=1 Tax=Thalictrum thalictroides TaxID=46969 RepID=A0A7J6V0V2_THATH|nr:hypothetical protein FRX31_032075 [Thalictrum thalictroides]
MEAARKEDNQQVLKVLEALKQASQDIHKNPTSKNNDSNSSPIKALLELQTEADNILSNDPNLSKLSNHISNLKNLISNLNTSHGHGIRSFLLRRVNRYEISRVARSIEAEIQAWIDRESIENLVKSLRQELLDEEEKIKLLSQFEERVSQGFDLNLQDSFLKWKVFSVLESVLCNLNCSKEVRERSAFAIAALVQFNKDVFVGEVLMGSTVKALICMASSSSIQVLCSLIRSIKSPLVDEIESNGGIPKLINLLNSQHELSIKVVTLDCVLEIGYFGRKEAIEAMLEAGLVKKLIELQRSELGGDLIEMSGFEEEKECDGVCVGGVEKELKGKKQSREKRFFEKHPFVSCVARFAIQLEVGEGLRQRERRAFKQEIVKRVREAAVSDAEAATVVAEVLWGSSP